MASGEMQPYYQNGNGKSGLNGNSVQFVTSIAAFLSLFASVGLALWTNAKGDVNTVKAELRDDIKQQELRVNNEIAVLRNTIENKLLTTGEYKEFVIRMDKLAESNKEDIRSIRQELVPRSEHAQHWAEFTDRVNSLRFALDQERQERATSNADIRKEFGSTFTAGDQMKNLQDQIKQLQARIDQLGRQGGNPNNPSLPLSVPVTPLTQGGR